MTNRLRELLAMPEGQRALLAEAIAPLQAEIDSLRLDLRADKERVRPVPFVTPAQLPFVEQINLLHVALFGWPCDHLTPLEQYLKCGNIREVALLILDGERFRWDIQRRLALLPEERWVMTESNDLKIWVNLADSFVSYGILRGTWESVEVRFMLSRLRPGDAVVDAGANVGLYTLEAARAVGRQGHVYAFEPMPSVNDMLRRSIVANDFDDRVTAFEVALGAVEAKGFLVPPADKTNQGATRVALGVEIASSPVSIRPLDSFEFAGPLRFIKIDVESSELTVLNGAEKTIRADRPTILIEVSADGCAPEVAKRLKDLGYRVSMFDQNENQVELDQGQVEGLASISEPLNLVADPIEVER